MNLKKPLMVSVALAGLCGVASLAAYPHMPELIPTHWGFDGQPDGYSRSWAAAILIPIQIVVLSSVVALLARHASRQANLERSAGALFVAIVGLSLMMACLHLATLANALGKPVDMGRIATSASCLLLAAVGNVLGKTRSNPVIGVRTQWTMASERVWDRTNRLGGRLMVLQGLVLGAAAWLLPSGAYFMAPLLLIGCLLLTSFGLYRYSRKLYEREQSGGQ